MHRRIAIFDYQILPTNAIGGCHLRILQGICHDHEFTVFTVTGENPCPERIHWVRIPAPTRPQALLFVVYHLLAPLYYWAYCLRHRVRFDLVQIVESNLIFADVAYSHFCHRAYLKHYGRQSGAKGLKGWLRRLDYQLHASLEPWIYRRVRQIVVPSRGLARELKCEYPHSGDKIHILPNPVDVERMRSPEGFDREGFRQGLGIGPEDLVFVFVALGQFERKGLPLLLEALAQLGKPWMKLVVVGGEADLVSVYQTRANRMGLASQVVFTGMQRDVQTYLWAADAFTLASFYEVFPLVALEAAAAGLPLIVTPLNGVEEFLCDGENGILVAPTSEGVSQGIARFLELSPEVRLAMGARAQQDVKMYATENFVAAWRDFYGSEG